MDEDYILLTTNPFKGFHLFEYTILSIQLGVVLEMGRRTTQCKRILKSDILKVGSLLLAMDNGNQFK